MARQGISCHIDYGLINLATGEQTAERGTICIRSTMKMPTLRQAALKTAQDKYQIPGVVAVTGVRIVKFTGARKAWEWRGLAGSGWVRHSKQWRCKAWKI